MRTLVTAFALISYSVVFGRLVQKPGLVVPDSYGSNLAAAEEIFDKSYAAYRSAKMFRVSQLQD